MHISNKNWLSQMTLVGLSMFNNFFKTFPRLFLANYKVITSTAWQLCNVMDLVMAS